MLTDQSFSAVPVIIVGPELFWDAHTPVHINFAHAFAFRNYIANFTVAYVSSAVSAYGDQEDFSRKLLKLGLSFAMILPVTDMAFRETGLNKNLSALFSNAALVYSPEFITIFGKDLAFSHRKCYSARPDTFIETLAYFSESAEPFSEETFQQKYHNNL